jgi:type II secretion system protein I
MKQAARGFTLIEVLIALAIVSIALAAMMRSVAVATDDQSRLRDRRLALLCAQDRRRMPGSAVCRGAAASWCFSIWARAATASRSWN